jgi:hypothetical protein
VRAPTSLTRIVRGVSLNSDVSGLVFNLINGDLNGDNVIDDADLLIVLFNFGTSNAAVDLNGDGGRRRRRPADGAVQLRYGRRQLRGVALLALQFGAGKIGRGFLAQLYARSGFETIFVEARAGPRRKPQPLPCLLAGMD